MRQVYLAATGRNRGKTTLSLGLLAALIDRGMDTAFTKPVGQRYAMVDEVPADEDAILMKELFDLRDPFGDMSPVHIPRGFTKSFIKGEVVQDLASKILVAPKNNRTSLDQAAISRFQIAAENDNISFNNIPLFQ